MFGVLTRSTATAARARAAVTATGPASRRLATKKAGKGGAAGRQQPAPDAATPPPTEASADAPLDTPSSLPSLDFNPAEADAVPKGRTGATSRSNVSSAEQERQKMGRITAGVLFLAFGLNVAYMSRDWEKDELEANKLVRCTLSCGRTSGF